MLGARKIIISRNVVFDESSYPLRDQAKDGPAQPMVAINMVHPGPFQSTPTEVPSKEVAAPEVFKAAAERTRPREPSGAALRAIAGGDSSFASVDCMDMPDLVDNSDSDSEDSDY